LGRRLNDAGRRLTAAATLAEKKEELELAFRTGMSQQLDLPLANVVVQGTAFKAIPGTTKVEVEISFYIIVPANMKVEDFQTTLTQISTGATQLDTFTKTFQDEMAAAGVSLSVDADSIRVATPVLTTVQVAKAPEEEEDDADEGGGGVVVIVVVVLVVLAVVGLVVWKFVLKK